MLRRRLSKSPTKGVATPAKINQSPAKSSTASTVKTPAKKGLKTPLTKLAANKTPMSALKRGFVSQDVEEEADNAKRGKATPKGRKSFSVIPTPEEIEQSSHEDKEEDDSDDKEIDINKSGSADEEDSEQEDDLEADDSIEEDDEEQSETMKVEGSQKTKKKKLKKDKELIETPRIVIKNLRPRVTENDIKAHFKDCGDILQCHVKICQKPKCFILFKELFQAKCAVSIKNDKPFQGQPLTVELCKVLHQFTKENSVTITDLPRGVSKHIFDYAKKAMKQFGVVKKIKFSSKMVLGNVMFANNDAVIAALKAGTVEVMGKHIKIVEFTDVSHSTPDTSILLYGITPAIKTENIQDALSNHSSVGTVFIGNNKAGQLKTYAQAEVISEENVEKLLAMKTLKVNNITLDIVPVPKSKFFFNRDTGIFFRHPTSIFVENLNPKTPEAELWKIFACFGVVERINFINKNHAAMIVYEHKEAAKKALDAGIKEIFNAVVKLHAVDGVHRPGVTKTFDEKTTLYMSGIKEMKHISDLIKKVRETGVNFTRIIPISDCLTKVFKNASFMQFENENDANVVLDSKLKMHKYLVTVEKYNSAKHDFVTQDTNVLVENLDANIKEADLWKSFHTFGEINNTTILRSKNVSIGCGYIEFKTADAAEKAIKAGTVEINGNKALVIKPTRDIVDKLRKRVPDAFFAKLRNQRKGKVFKKGPHTFNKKSKSFNKSPHAVKKTTSFKKSGGFKKSPRRSF